LIALHVLADEGLCLVQLLARALEGVDSTVIKFDCARSRHRPRGVIVSRYAGQPLGCGLGEDLEMIDVALIREATKQIDMATYVTNAVSEGCATPPDAG
jgi:hypothetical protein